MFIGDNLNAYWIKSDESSSFIEYFNVPDGLSMITAYDRNDISSDRIKNYLSKFSLATFPHPGKDEWQDWETLLGSTYSHNNEPLSAMCIKTDIGFQTVSSCLIAVPGFQPNRGSKKPVFRYANGSPDLNSFEELEIWHRNTVTT